MREREPPVLLRDLVVRARNGDVQSYGRLVEATQRTVLAVALRVLGDRAAAQDAAQDTYLRAFRRLEDLHDPAAFSGWLRRIAVTVATDMKRRQRGTFLRLDEVPDVPVLDELETGWTDRQRHRLAAALLTLGPEERRLCDRRYHGGWSVGRLATHAGVDEAAMRKRLQRIRDKLRKEIEMTERYESAAGPGKGDLPAKVVELLARPQLTNLPENPVGRTSDTLRALFPEFRTMELPEVIDLAAARATIAADALYVDESELHHLDARRILRYDLTLPLLLTARFEGEPLRVWAEGKAYRRCAADTSHLEAFHQAEAFWLDARERIDPWQFTGRVLQTVHALLPSCPVRIVPTTFPMCTQAWELEAERDGRSLEVLAWGVFTDRIVAHLGGDPARHAAIGVGYGLERLASLEYGIDDVRKIEVATVKH